MNSNIVEGYGRKNYKKGFLVFSSMAGIVGLPERIESGLKPYPVLKIRKEARLINGIHHPRNRVKSLLEDVLPVGQVLEIDEFRSHKYSEAGPQVQREVK